MEKRTNKSEKTYWVRRIKIHCKIASWDKDIDYTYWFPCVLHTGFCRNRLSSVERVGPVGRTVRTGRTGLPVSPDPSGPSGIRGWVAGVAEVPGGWGVPGGAGVVGAAGAAASIGPELAPNTRKGWQSGAPWLAKKQESSCSSFIDRRVQHVSVHQDLLEKKEIQLSRVITWCVKSEIQCEGLRFLIRPEQREAKGE